MIQFSSRIGAAALAAALLLFGGCQPGANQQTGATSTGCQSGLAPGSTDPDSGLPVRSLDQLPKQAAETFALVLAGGPYPYPRNDDKTYNNRNRVLPQAKRGFYREYTVKTPGSRDRGARRLVRGGTSGCTVYYTGDHYESFVRIA